jgi:uncharacterized protein YkwD
MPAPQTQPARRLPSFVAAAALLVAGLALAPMRAAAVAERCAATPPPDDALRRVNAVRAAGAPCRPAGHASVAPLRWNTQLADVASAQAQEMAWLDRMGHRDRLDRGLGERLLAMGYRFSAAVENVALGYASLDAVVDAWLASDSHCMNLMHAAALELGMACIDGASATATESRYWTLVLGAPRQP